MIKLGKITKFDGKKIYFIEEKNETLFQYELAEWVKAEFVKLGEAEITIDSNQIVTFVAMVEDLANQDSKEKKDPKKKWEDDIVSFEVLLTAAHKKAKESDFGLNIKTNVIRDESGKPLINLAEKFAVFKARVFLTDITGKEIQSFEGHGDATDTNVKGEHIKPHFIRMAETRAIVRALRWYTNNGCAEEEK